MPAPRLYNPSGIAAAFVSPDKYSSDARQAGARAILRHGQHTSNYHATRSPGGLHPLYMDIHGRGGQTKAELQEIDKVISESMLDTFDLVRFVFMLARCFFLTL